MFERNTCNTQKRNRAKIRRTLLNTESANHIAVCTSNSTRQFQLSLYSFKLQHRCMISLILLYDDLIKHLLLCEV